jgi:hypothetical protein
VPFARLGTGVGYGTEESAAELVYIDGYVTMGGDGRCVLVKQHDGSTYYLRGGWVGLVGNDHVRLAGRFVPDPACGAPSGFEVTEVRTIWSDSEHHVISYDRDRDGVFRTWAERHRRHERREKDREHREREHEAPPPRR